MTDELKELADACARAAEMRGQAARMWERQAMTYAVALNAGKAESFKPLQHEAERESAILSAHAAAIREGRVTIAPRDAAKGEG